MNTARKSTSILPGLVLGAALASLPTSFAFAAPPEGAGKATRARASGDGPMTAESAEALARHHQEQAERYRALGGVGYKTGLVQRAEQDAAKYAALAAQLRAPASPPPARSPEAEYWAGQVERYKSMGGVAYKTGLVERAEAELRKHEPPRPEAAPAPRQFEGRWDWRWGKPIERFLAGQK